MFVLLELPFLVKLFATLSPGTFFCFLCSTKMVIDALNQIRSTGNKTLAVLVDPDDSKEKMIEVAESALLHGIHLFLVGGSLVTHGNTDRCAALLKSLGAPQVVLFPGNEIQVTAAADAIFFMSLVSGRNPEFLIGKQVNAAPWVKKAGLETIPTAYMLVESGRLTSALYMSHTLPLPSNKPDIAGTTALAAEMLGMKVFYLDAGSGAENPVPKEIIAEVRKQIAGCVIVGGGIRNSKSAQAAWDAGADVVVIGNGAFEDIDILKDIARAVQKYSPSEMG